MGPGLSSAVQSAELEWRAGVPRWCSEGLPEERNPRPEPSQLSCWFQPLGMPEPAFEMTVRYSTFAPAQPHRFPTNEANTVRWSSKTAIATQTYGQDCGFAESPGWVGGVPERRQDGELDSGVGPRTSLATCERRPEQGQGCARALPSAVAD